ncbi:MAG: glycosyltransferase [Verrucomicrobiae bacterium]|nr:glycosyltransferase [Verrucomicrobiae bacterium]
MIYLALAISSLILAGIPAVMILRNRTALRSPAPVADGIRLPAVSVLIPARDEEENIVSAVDSVLANAGVELEVIVLDDQSQDGTAELVRDLSARDPRVRLETAPPLPAGWCGKMHACHVLAGLARHPVLVFLDADVRLTPDALGRMLGFLQAGRADLISGVPRQITGTWLEKLVLPLIEFVLLGHLPLRRMRRRTSPAYGAGCGQLFMVRAKAYFQAGGHAAIRSTLHDGLKLPRAFRAAGLRTDLFNANDLARCRMYRNAAGVVNGLLKNAREGLAAPRMILPATLLLMGGHVAPWILLGWGLVTDSPHWELAALAVLLSGFPRLLMARWFRQSPGWALLHPVAITLFLGLQWWAWGRAFFGCPATWKGRSYPATGVPATGEALSLRRRAGEQTA